MRKIKIITIVFIYVFAGALGIGRAAVMSSANYGITADVLSDGGGNSASANYNISGTMWQSAVGPSSSSNYSLIAGYWSDGITDIPTDTTPPTDGTLTAIPQNTANAISWSGFSDASGIASYKLVYSTTVTPALCSGGTLIYSGAGTSYTHGLLTNGTTYYYRVCATDNAGNTSIGVTANATPAAPADLSISSTDTNTAGIERTDGGDDSNNLDTSTIKPKVDIGYEFKIVLKTPTGEVPQYVRLYLTDRSSPAFHAIDMICAGDWALGAVCVFPMKLGPAAVHKFHFEAMLADGSIVTYPSFGDITGPIVNLLNGYGMVGIARDIALANLDAAAGMGCTTAYRWVSTGLSTTSGNKGGYELVDSANPLKPGEGYFVKRDTCVSNTLPELNAYSDITASSYTITLNPGWNIVSNPYNAKILLSNVQVQKDADAPVSWTQATTNSWLINSIYYYKGTDWGQTYFSESAGASPDDATLVPWLGYWMYLKKIDGVYKLVIPKP